MRIRSFDTKRSHIIYNHQPFTGQGVSLYGTIGNTVRYRNLRIVGNKFLETVEFDIGATSVTKTARLASESSPTTSIDYTFPATWHDEDIALDVRTYKDDVENNTDNHRTGRVSLFGDELEDQIYGTAILIGVEQRDAGICRISFIFEQALAGLPALMLTAIRTAGPTSPGSFGMTADPGRQTYYLDTLTLSDSAPYTYKIQAANGIVTADVLTGITVQADATGPTAPTAGTGTPW